MYKTRPSKEERCENEEKDWNEVHHTVQSMDYGVCDSSIANDYIFEAVSLSFIYFEAIGWVEQQQRNK